MQILPGLPNWTLGLLDTFSGGWNNTLIAIKDPFYSVNMLFGLHSQLIQTKQADFQILS